MHPALPLALALLAALSGPAGAQPGGDSCSAQAVCRALLSQLACLGGRVSERAESRSRCFAQVTHGAPPAAEQSRPQPASRRIHCAADASRPADVASARLARAP
jgi:hypothetical protein